MKNVAIISLLIFAFAGAANAAKALQTDIKVPDGVPKAGFRLDVNNGEKRTQFIVWSDNKGKFYSGLNGASARTGKLSEKNYKFLTAESARIVRMPASSVASCPTQNIKLATQSGAKSLTTCIGATSATAKKMKSMANLMSLLI